VRRPDGDVELRDAGSGFLVPPCASCGGVLKPAVVFFGDSVPRQRVDRCGARCLRGGVVGCWCLLLHAYGCLLPRRGMWWCPTAAPPPPPPPHACRALEMAGACDLMLVVGSSLYVWSAFRLVKAAKAAGAKLAIVNVGQTRADDMADLKVEALAGEVMARLAAHPSLLLPRI